MPEVVTRWKYYSVFDGLMKPIWMTIDFLSNERIQKHIILKCTIKNRSSIETTSNSESCRAQLYGICATTECQNLHDWIFRAKFELITSLTFLSTESVVHQKKKSKCIDTLIQILIHKPIAYSTAYVPYVRIWKILISLSYFKNLKWLHRW